MKEWMNLFAWQKNKTISQAKTPRHDNCMRLPVSWVNNYTGRKPGMGCAHSKIASVARVVLVLYVVGRAY